MNWADLEGNSKSPPIPRKKKAAANTAGKRRGNIIKPPSENLDDIFSPSRDDGSDSSHFSRDPCIDGESTKRDERRSLQRRQDSDRKRGQTQDRKDNKRRNKQKQKMIDMQRKKDSQQPECIDIADDDDNRHISPGKSTFDGVRTDRVTNVQNLEYMNNVRERFPGNDNDDSVEVGEDRGKSSKRDKKNKNYRGNTHERSSMAVRGTPRNRDSQKHRNKKGRSRQHDVLNQSYNTSDDPLDQAAQIQEANRPRSSSKVRSNPYSDLHPDKTKNTSEEGIGIWGNVTSSARKCVNGVKECVKQLTSSPSKSRRGKSGSMTQRMGKSMEILGNGNMESNREQRRQRKRCGEAAQSRQDRREKQPTSGEKRKREYTNDAIELDQSVCAVDESQEMKGNNNIDEEELEIVGAIEGASTHVSQADYEHLPTTKQANFAFLRRVPEKNDSRNNGKKACKSLLTSQKNSYCIHH